MWTDALDEQNMNECKERYGKKIGGKSEAPLLYDSVTIHFETTHIVREQNQAIVQHKAKCPLELNQYKAT